MLVPAIEMAGPARLDSLQLLCGSPDYNHGRFDNVRLLLTHTPLTLLTATYDSNYGGNTPVPVMGRAELQLSWQNGEWGSFKFDSAFDYDGISSLLIEFRWEGDNDSAVYVRGWYPSGGARVLDGYSLTSPTGTLRDYSNCMRVHYSVTGIGDAPGRSRAQPARLHVAPDPMTSSAVVSYYLSRAGRVSLLVFDASGRVRRTLADERVSAGTGSWRWDGRDDAGTDCPAGIYACRLTFGSETVLRTVRLLR